MGNSGTSEGAVTLGNSAFDVELIWLDTTLEPHATRTPPPAKKSPSVIAIALLVSVLLAVGGLWVKHTLRPSAAEHMQAGWQAYRHGDYDGAAVALAAAKAQTPDLPDIPELKLALDVAPTVDAIQADLDDGRIQNAQERIEAVLVRAPNDRRAVRLAIRLRTIQANAALAKADVRTGLPVPLGKPPETVAAPLVSAGTPSAAE